LSIKSQEFITAPAVISYLKSIQHATATAYVPAIFARRFASHRTSLSGNQTIFNQIRLTFDKPSIEDSSQSSSLIAPVGLKVVSSPVKPETRSHFGATYHSPFASDWRDALFQNYNKMLASGHLVLLFFGLQFHQIKRFFVHELHAKL